MRAALLALLLTAGPSRSEPAPNDGDRFAKEDWVATVEPDHQSYWGIDWGVNNLYLPQRAIQRGVHAAETRWLGNFRGSGGGSGGFRGGALRFFFGVMPDFALFGGPLNLHHVMGHDAAAREMARGFGLGTTPERYKQVLPTFLGGRELKIPERSYQGGPDAAGRNVGEPMEAENHFAYVEGKGLLGAEEPNATAVVRYLVFRERFYHSWFDDPGALDQGFLSAGRPNNFQTADSRTMSDFTAYLYSLNTDRYGQTQTDRFNVNMTDMRQAFRWQLVDPVQWAALYALSRDFVGRGSNRVRVPMIPLGERVRYLPGFRVYFSPFGIEHFVDNYFRCGPVLVNAWVTRGAKGYEPRRGGGVEVEGIPLPRHAKLSVFAAVIDQPLLSRIVVNAPLTQAELGRTHAAYNVGGSLQVPVWRFRDGDDPERLFLYLRGGTKNLSWFPGAYLLAGTYLQTGMGLRL